MCVRFRPKLYELKILLLPGRGDAGCGGGFFSKLFVLFAARARRFRHGQDSGSLRGFLHLLLRWVAQEQPSSTGPVEVEYRRQTGGREPRAVEDDPGGSGQDERRAGHGYAENRRLLRLMYG